MTQSTVLLALAALIVALIVWRRVAEAQRFRPMPFRPTNRLEELLEQAVGTADGPTALKAELLQADVLSLQSEDDPAVPATFTARFAAGVAGSSEPVEFGPWVIAFSSHAVLDGAYGSPAGELLVQAGRIGRFTGRRLAERAIDANVDLALNPFGGVGRRFTPEELRRLVQPG